MENNQGKLGCDQNPCPWDRWTIARNKCTTCCECVDACLIGLLYFDEAKKAIIMKNEGRTCTQCGDCASACAYDAIELT